VAVMCRRPVEVDAINGSQRGIFPIPPIEMNERTRATDRSAPRCDLAHQHAICPHRRSDFTVRIESNDAAYVRLECPHFSIISRGANGSNLATLT